MERVVQAAEQRETARAPQHGESAKGRTVRASNRVEHEHTLMLDEAARPVTAFVTEWYIRD